MPPFATTILALVIGFILGFVAKWLLSRGQKTLTCDSELGEVKQTFSLYQQQVSQHMTKTADLVNDLKQQCDDIQAHIFNGASALNRDSDRHSFLQPKTHGTYTDPAVEALKNLEDDKSTKGS